MMRWAIERVGRVLREKIGPQRILVVQDTPKHIDAGWAVGAVTFGIATGHYNEAKVREAGADYVVGWLREPLPGFAAGAVTEGTMSGLAKP